MIIDQWKTGILLTDPNLRWNTNTRLQWAFSPPKPWTIYAEDEFWMEKPWVLLGLVIYVHGHEVPKTGEW